MSFDRDEPDPVGLHRATHLLEIGRPAEALALAEQAVLADPDDVRALGTLSRCLLGLGRHDRAAQTARRAIIAAPDDPWPHRLLALSLSGLGRRRDAVTAQTEAVRLAPESAHTLAELATLLADDKRRQAAKEAIERARAMQPDDPAVALRESYVALTARRWADAELAARRVLESDPDDPDAINNLGVALDGQGRRAEALDLFARAAGSEPAGPGADNARDTAKRIAGVATVSAIGIGLFIGLRQLGTAAFGALPGSWQWPAIGVGLAAVVAVIVAGERHKKREHAQLSPHARRLVDDARREDLQRRRQEMRDHESTFVKVLVGCVAGSAIALVAAGATAIPFVVVAGILAVIMLVGIAAGRMADDPS